MRNVSIAVAGALALLLAGIFVWNAKATPLTGAATAGSATSYLLLEKVLAANALKGSEWFARRRAARAVPLRLMRNL